MKLVSVLLEDGEPACGALEGEWVHLFADIPILGEVFMEQDPTSHAKALRKASVKKVKLADVELDCPADLQEVWAAGVTYKRSKIAREEESAGAAQFYDKVYTADRPELFLKAPPGKCVGPNGGVRIRSDSKWNVPEPELAFVISPDNEIVGYTIGNDMSSRDIEGENPLYLPQAKIYTGSCAIGPCIVLCESMPKLEDVEIKLLIERDGKKAFEGATSFSQFNRKPEDLVDWLTRENDFPFGAILLTGTGIVPPDDFTLELDDVVSISITGIGTLTNRVE